MKTSRLSLLMCLTLLACGTPTDPSTEPVSFTHTVSFGFCPPTVYCSSRLELSPQEAVLTWETRQGSGAMQFRAPGAAPWSKVSAALDAAGLRALPDVVGCPDCADGGAESVTVAFDDGQVERVTFEYRDDVRGIEALVAALREVRESFPPPPPTAPAP